MPFALLDSDSGGLGQNGGALPAINAVGADLIVVSVGWYPGITADVSVTDDSSNTYVPLTKQAASEAANQLFYVLNPTVDASVVVSVTGSDTYPSAEVLAFSGAAAAGFDQQNGAQNDAATALATGSVTPTEDNELVVCGIGHSDNSAGAVSIDGSGFTALVVAHAAGTNVGSGLARKIQTTAGAENRTWDVTNQAQLGVTIATFKAAAGAVGGHRRPARMLLGVGR